MYGGIGPCCLLCSPRAYQKDATIAQHYVTTDHSPFRNIDFLSNQIDFEWSTNTLEHRQICPIMCKGASVCEHHRL